MCIQRRAITRNFSLNVAIQYGRVRVMVKIKVTWKRWSRRVACHPVIRTSISVSIGFSPRLTYDCHKLQWLRYHQDGTGGGNTIVPSIGLRLFTAIQQMVTL